jgi:hypothetical protein
MRRYFLAVSSENLKFTLEQAMKAQVGTTSIAVLFL